MICLTGDVHHMSLRTKDQDFLTATEAELAKEYLKIAQKREIKVTLFLTGKLVEEETDNVAELLKTGNVELGGHNYNAFQPRLIYGISNKLLGLRNGPRFYQRREIKKTIQIFEGKIGVRTVSWRDHAYRHDRNTFHLLSDAGIKYVSDVVNKEQLRPKKVGGLIAVPINVMPDHEHIYHSFRTPLYVNSSDFKDNFTSESYCVDEWARIIQNQVENIEAKNGITTILAHPSCMYICGGFAVFRKLCEFLSQYETTFMKDIPEEFCYDEGDSAGNN